MFDKCDAISAESFGRVGVIYGGWSEERSVSLQSGTCMVNACKRLGLDVAGFDVASPRDVFELAKHDVQVFLLGLHGGAGEDGHVQAALDLMGLNYIGSGMHSSSLCMNKVSARLACKAIGVPVMPWQTFHSASIPLSLDFDFPICLKPVSSGSSIGVTKVQDFADWQNKSRGLSDGWWMLEPWFDGIDHFVGVLGEQAMPVLEVELPPGQFFDYNNKYSQDVDRQNRFVERPDLQDWTLQAFEVLKCRDYARADFISVGERSWFLEMNTLPGMAPTCLLPTQASHAGIGYEELLFGLLKRNQSQEDLVCQ